MTTTDDELMTQSQQGTPTTDWRALCVELLAALKNAIRVVYHEGGTQHISTADPVIAKADIALAQSDGPAVPEGREPASVIGEPSDVEQVAQQVFEAMRFSGATSPAPPEWVSGGNSLMQDHARDAARAVLARRGHQPAPHDDRGVLPMIVSETGACDEPETERIICASISGGADYINNMPRTLTLERINSEGSTYQKYIQDPIRALADHPAPQSPADGEVGDGEIDAFIHHWWEAYGKGYLPNSSDKALVAAALARFSRPAPQPPVEGEVGELVAKLRTKATTEYANGCDYSAVLLVRAAELLGAG